MAVPIIEQGYTSGLCYWDGSAWQRWTGLANPLPVSLALPHRNRISPLISVSTTGVGTAGTVNVDIATVPAGQYWFVQQWGCFNNTGGNAQMRLEVNGNGTSVWVRNVFASVQFQILSIDSPFIVGPSSQLRAVFVTSGVGDALFNRVLYYRLDI